MGTIAISGTNHDAYGETADPVVDAKAYLAAKIGGETWGDADKLNQRQAMVTATRWIRRYLDTHLGDDTPDPATVPAPLLVSQATYETAFVLITTPTAQDKKTTGSNNKRLKAGPAEIEYFRPTDGTPLPQIANDLLVEYLRAVAPVSEGFGALASGTDGVSEFCDQDAWARDRAFP